MRSAAPRNDSALVTRQLRPPASARETYSSSAESLRGATLLTYTSGFQMLQDAKWFQPLLASARVALETNSTHALAAAARAGLGVAVLPRFVACRDADLIAVSDAVAEHDVWLLTHPDLRHTARVRRFIEFMGEAMAGSRDAREGRLLPGASRTRLQRARGPAFGGA